MKILIIGNFLRSWDESIPDEKHIADSLKILGNKVTEWQRKEDLSTLPNKKFDFILIAQWYLYPRGICKSLKDIYGCPVVYWAFDYQFDSNEDWHLEMAKEADLFLSKEMEHKEFYNSIGANFHWLPADFSPMFLERRKYNAVRPEDKEYDIIFTGSFVPHATYRNELLKRVDNKYDLHIFSTTAKEWIDLGMKNVHGPIIDEGLMELIPKARINLSIDWKQSEGYWSDRNAQIMVCGGFVLFKYVPMSEMVFGNAIEYFNTDQECFDKIDLYLANPNKVMAMESIAYRSGKHNLKVINRVGQLLTIVKEKLL